MSAITKTATVTCPACGAQGEAPIWDEIDAQQTRRDARHVLNETLFEVKCNQCGTASSLNYPLVYHDGENRFCVHYVVTDDAAQEASAAISQTALAMRAQAAYAAARADKASEEEAKQAAQAVREGPNALDGYRFRIVRTRNALREKVVVLRNGLDDRAVEVLKVTTFNLAASQGKLKGASEPYFGGVKKSGAILIDFVGGRSHRETKVPASLYESVLADVQAAFPEDSDPMVDKAWAERFLEQQKESSGR